jgi:signal transduction histidine kinase
MSTPAALSHEDLASLAHELRGALTIIAGYTELLRRPVDSADRMSALDGIERAIRRADALCADALAGRRSAFVPADTFIVVSLADLAEQVVGDQRSATGRLIEVTIEGGAQILGEPDALTRVLGNLIDNAAKYSLTSAPIDVLIAEEDGASGPLSVAEVSDRGPGIPADEIERILEPFERLERDRESTGTGLGLAIARNVVEAHNGRLSVLEREGGGAVVRLEFPRA